MEDRRTALEQLVEDQLVVIARLSRRLQLHEEGKTADEVAEIMGPYVADTNDPPPASPQSDLG